MSGFVINKGSEARQFKAFTHVVADIPGGGVLVTSDLTENVVIEGTPLGKDSDGKWHIIKRAEVTAVAGASDTTYTVKKGHNLTTNDFVTFAKGGKAYKISQISDNASDSNCDDIKVATTLGAAAVGDVLIQAKASTADASAYKYEPEGLLGKSYNVEHNLFVQIVTIGQIDSAKLPIKLGKIMADLPLIKVI